MSTRGLSPKVLYPFLALQAGAITDFIAHGEFTRTGIALAIGGLVQAVLGYLANPGTVTFSTAGPEATIPAGSQPNPPPPGPAAAPESD